MNDDIKAEADTVNEIRQMYKQLPGSHCPDCPGCPGCRRYQEVQNV